MPPDIPRKVQIPRWVQLVGLPLLIVGAWQLVSAVSHAVFIFIVAALIAILLNPIVRAFSALRIPRPAAVLLVYLMFALAFVAAGVLAGTVIATQVQAASTVVQKEFSTQPGQSETTYRLVWSRHTGASTDSLIPPLTSRPRPSTPSEIWATRNSVPSQGIRG